MNLPSIKTLRAIAHDRAPELRELLEQKRKTRDYQSVRDWIRQCYHEPRYYDRMLCAANEICGTCGVEGFRARNGYYWEYLNTGDTYTPTLLLNRTTGRFAVTSWGDIVERHGTREW